MNTVRALSASLAAALTLTAASTAFAQEPAPVVASSRGGLGVGVTQMLNGPGGIDIIFDAGRWHADAFLGVAGNGATDLNVGARGWFHLHSSTNADFSLGGGIGLDYTNPDGPPDSVTDIHIDLGAMIRAFITSNVAISAFAGIGIVTGDSDGLFRLSGQPLGALGIAYYFW